MATEIDYQKHAHELQQEIVETLLGIAFIKCTRRQTLLDELWQVAQRHADCCHG